MNNKIINAFIRAQWRFCLAIIMVIPRYCYGNGASIVISNSKKAVSSIKEVPAQDGWINSLPLNLATLNEQALVLLPCWTLSDNSSVKQISLLNTLNNYYKKYRFQTIGIHSPRFEIEKEPKTVLQAVKYYHISYPVLLDGDHQWWKKFGITQWPTTLLQTKSKTVYKSSGTLDEYELELEIRRQLATLFPKEPLPPFLYKSKNILKKIEISDTLFAGYDFMKTSFGNVQVPIVKKNIQFTIPALSFNNKINLQGTWFIHKEFIVSTGQASIIVPYKGSSAALFLDTDITQPVKIEVLIDGKPIIPLWQGSDIEIIEGKTMMKIDQARLYYPLSNQIPYDKHVLTIKTPNGLTFYLISFDA